MTAWTSDELNKIGKAEELQIASLRRDGTLRKPVTIWVMRVGDPDGVGGELHVRSYRGRNGAWYRNAQARLKARSRPVASQKTSASLM